MIDIQAKLIGECEQRANRCRLGHGRVDLIRVIVKSTFLAKAKHTATGFKLVDAAITRKLYLEDELSGYDLTVLGRIADLEGAFID